MADVPQYTTVARPRDYWMSPKALSITLNALGEANRIAASVIGGSQFFCHFEDIGDQQAEALFGYDVAHNFRSWPLNISQTYFNTNETILPHIAIPRRDKSDAKAMVVFPTERLDLWGYATDAVPMQDEDGNYIDDKGDIVDRPEDAATAYVRKKKTDGSEQDADPIGSEDYYYIYLHGKIMFGSFGYTYQRYWDPEIDTGRLNTDETWGEVITLEQLAREMKKKVDVEWFQRVFTIHGTGRKRKILDYDEDGNPIYDYDEDGNIIYEGEDDERRDIKPNDMDHEITDTQSMFGTWTEQFLSALGIGSGSGSGGGGDALEDPLLSINSAGLGQPPTPETGKITIVYNYATSRWEWGKTGGGLSGLTLKDDNDLITPTGTDDNLTYNLGAKFLSLTHGGTVLGDVIISGATLTISTRPQGFTAGDNDVLTKKEMETLFADKYVTTEFFKKLFRAQDVSGDVNPNDMDATITSIKLMFGTWTEQYLSALGIGSSGGSGGGTPLNDPLMSINGLESNPSSQQIGYTLVWKGQGQGTKGTGWAYEKAGLDETALATYLINNKYLTETTVNGYTWWGRQLVNGVVSGDIKNADNIYINKNKFVSIQFNSTTQYSVLGMGSDNVFLIGWGLKDTAYNTTVASGNDLNIGYGTNTYDSFGKYWTVFHNSGHVTINTNDNTVSGRDIFLNVGGNTKTSRLYLYIDSSGDTTKDVYLEYDGSNKGVHIVNAGMFADTYVSSLGVGSTGGAVTGIDWDALVHYDNDSSHRIDYHYLSQVTKTLTLRVNGTTYTYNGTADSPVIEITSGGSIATATDVNSYFTADKKAIDADKLDGKHLSELFETLKNSEASGHTDDVEVKIGGETKYLTVGYASKAGQLKTDVKLWDNTFNGTQSIGTSASNASLSYVRDITMSGNVRMNRGQFVQMYVNNDYRNVLGVDSSLNILSLGYRTAEQGLDTNILGANVRLYYYNSTSQWQEGLTLTSGGLVGIGNGNPSCRLDVNGSAYVSSDLRVGNERMGWVNNGYTDNEDVFFAYSWDSSAGTSGLYRNMLFGTYADAIEYGGLFWNGTTWSWGIGTKTPQTKLDVNGSVKATRFYLYKDASDSTKDVYLEYVNNVGGVHLYGAGFYADQYVSSLGLGSDGTASVFDEDQMWLALGGTMQNQKIANSHLNLFSLSIITKNGTQEYNPASGSQTIDISSLTGDYLPLTIPSGGKTVTMPSIGSLTFKSSASDYPMLRFEGATSGGLGFIGIGKTGSVIEPYYVTAVNGVYNDNQSQWYKLIHSGNMTELFTTLANSGDSISVTVGGTNKTLTVGFATTAINLRNIIMASGDNYDALSGYTPERGAFVATNWLTGSAFNSITLDGKGLYDTLVSFGYGNRTIQLKGSGWSDDLKYRHVYTQPNTSSTYVLSPWKTIAFTDGTIAKADRLSSNDTKTVWGQTYWNNGQPQNISGYMENVDDIFMNANKFIRIKDSESNYINMIGMDGSNNFSVFWGALAKGYTTGLYGNLVYIGHGHSGSNPAYYTSFQPNGHVTINAYDKTGYFLTVGGSSFANTVVGKQLKTDEGTAGETVVLNTSATYDCIVYQINGSSKWSVGSDSSGNFYWYTQPGGNKTVMSLTSAGHLKVESLQIGDITITVEKENNTSIGLRVSKGLAATTYVSALGTGSSGTGGGGADLSQVWDSFEYNNDSYANKKIDIHHFDTPLETYLSGKSYATESFVKNYVKTISWSTDTGHLNQLKYTNGNNSSSYVTIGYATKAGSVDSTARLSQTTLADRASIANFKHDTDLIYTAKGGGNGCQDKPVDTIDSFGLLSFKTASGYYGQILTATGGDMYYRTGSTLNGGWKQLLDSSNWSTLVTSAPRLSGDTQYSAWGKTYWSNGVPQSVSGEMSSVTSIDSLAYFYTSSRKQVRISSGAPTAAYTYKRDDVTYIPRLYVDDNLGVSNEVLAKGIDFIGENGNGGYLDFHYGAIEADFTTRIIETANGVLTVKKSGTSASDITGLVIGNNRNGDYIKIGGATLTWVAGQGLKIDTGFWSESFVSALGTGSSGSGGGGMTEDQMWTALNNNSDTHQIAGSHLNILGNYALKSELNNYMKGVKVGSTTYNTKDINGYVDMTAAFSGGGGSDGVFSSSLCVGNTYIPDNIGSPTFYVNGNSALIGCVAINTAVDTNYKLKVSGTSYFSGNTVVNGSDGKYFSVAGFKISYDGTDYLVGDSENEDDVYVYGTWFYRGGSRITSDITKKDWVRNVEASVEDVARTPIFDFTWKDSKKKDIQLGTSAQYIQKLFPTAVSVMKDGTLAMDYGATALAAAVMTARTVLSHEERIKKLEAENERLRTEIELLKAA